MADDPRRTDAGPDSLTILAFLAVTLLGGTNAIAVQLTVLELAPLWSAAIRFLAAAVLMIALAVVTRRSLPRGRSLWGTALYGLFGFTAAYGLGYTAIQDVPAGTLMVLVSLTPLFTFGLAIAHGQEEFHIQGLVGAVVAVIGIGIVFVDQLSADVPLLSLLLVILMAAAIAEAGVIVKWIPKSDPFATNGAAMLIGGLLLAVLSIVTSEPRAMPARTDTWIAMLYLVLLGSVAMFGLYVFALRRWTASAVSYVTLLMPVVTIVLAAALTGEQITASFVLGSAVIIGGVYVGAFLTRRPKRSTASSLPECLPTEDCGDEALVPRGAAPAD
ncbi:MAG TPA: EamA family transporter [Candidatus Limnocylindria bacterium]|nr:EamA family transporter [Candidatus Limnocylindria bacterium]